MSGHKHLLLYIYMFSEGERESCMWIHLFTSVCPKHLRLNAQTALLYQTPTLMYRCMWISAVLTQNNKDMSMFDRKEKREREGEESESKSIREESGWNRLCCQRGWKGLNVTLPRQCRVGQNKVAQCVCVCVCVCACVWVIHISPLSLPDSQQHKYCRRSSALICPLSLSCPSSLTATVTVSHTRWGILRDSRISAAQDWWDRQRETPLCLTGSATRCLSTQIRFVAWIGMGDGWTMVFKDRTTIMPWGSHAVFLKKGAL